MFKPEVCILGLPFGELGVGEQARGIIEIASHLNLKLKVFDFKHEEDRFSNTNTLYKKLETGKYDAPIKIFSLTQHHLAALLYRYGPELFENSYNIFHLAWEFSSSPPQLDSILYLADEIWGISEFVSSSFVNNSAGVPVKTYCNYVDTPKFSKKNREFYGLPGNKFLFLTSLDVNSFPKRKNTLQTVDVFKSIFKNNPDVGLVVKISNPDLLNYGYQELIRSIGDCGNIYLIEKNFSKEEVYGLYDSCDVYVSLHRSEGFGLVIAENMLIGKPVICTDYSGNLDFCSKKNSLLIPFELVPVHSGEYIMDGNFEWAEPCFKAAQDSMSQVYRDKDFYRQISQEALKTSKEFFRRDNFEKKLNLLMKDAIEKVY